MCAQPNGGLDCGLSVAMQRLTADSRLLSQQEIARCLIRSVALQAMVGDVFADANESLRHDLRIDVAVGEHRLRMEASGVLSFLDINGVVCERDCLHLAKFGATDVAEFLTAANFSFLGLEVVAMNRRLCGASNIVDKGKTGEARAFLK